MKKQTTKKVHVKAAAARGVNIKTARRPRESAPWSMSIYVYWFIILFFIAATFYILGRSHLMNNESRNAIGNENIEIIDTQNDNVAEEQLMGAADYYTHGKSEILAGNIENAIADLNAAIQIDATMVDAYILRGEAYMQTGDYGAAMNDFNSAIAIDASNSIAYYDRALLNARLEDFNSAMSDINNALATYVSNPNNVLQLRDLYAKRGQLNLWMKNWDGAIADYTNSLARPEGTVNPSVYAERAEAYTANGEYALAINDYSSAIRVISEQIQGAIATEQKEDLSMRAMNYFEKSAALNLSIGNAVAAKTDLEAAYAIATSLNDPDTIERLEQLIGALQ